MGIESTVEDFDRVRRWLIAYVADRQGVAIEAIDPSIHFAHYGFDSVDAVRLAADLEDWLGRALYASTIHDHPTIDRLARHLVDTL